MKHISQVNLGTRVYYHSHFFKATYTLKEMQQHQEKKKGICVGATKKKA